METEGCSYVFSKEEQLIAIKEVYEGRAKCCLMWEEPLVPNSAVCYGIRTLWR